MHVFLRVSRVDDFLSTSECLLLKNYTTEFLYGDHKTPNDRAGILWLYPTNNDIFKVNNDKPLFYGLKYCDMVEF